MIFIDYLVLLCISIIHIFVIYWFELRMFSLFKDKFEGLHTISFWDFIFNYLYEYEFTKLSSKMRIITPGKIYLLWGTCFAIFVPILVHEYLYKLDKFTFHPTFILLFLYILTVTVIPYILYAKEKKIKK
jgi:hypothetical protein